MTTTKSTNQYTNLKNKHREEFNNFPMMFAFSDKQFSEGMAKLGLTETDTDKILTIGGGGYIKKTDADLLYNMTTTHDKEMNEAIVADTTGDGFIYDMFLYELNNHEYGYTGDIDDTLNALDLTREQINENPILLHGLTKARNNAYREE